MRMGVLNSQTALGSTKLTKPDRKDFNLQLRFCAVIQLNLSTIFEDNQYNIQSLGT